MIDKPYTAQGDYNILSPNGDVTIFQGTFERDQILKLLNEAYSAGQASRSEQGMVLTDEVIGQTSAKFADQFDVGFMALGPKARCCRLIAEAIEHLRNKGYLSAPVEEVGEDQIQKFAHDFCNKYALTFSSHDRIAIIIELREAIEKFFREHGLALKGQELGRSLGEDRGKRTIEIIIDEVAMANGDTDQLRSSLSELFNNLR